MRNWRFLGVEARELEARIADNVAKLLEGGRE